MAFWKPGLKNGVRRREVYEDRGARISILAGGDPPRPDTLKQTDQRPIPTNPLQTGRAIRFRQIDVKRSFPIGRWTSELGG